MTTPRTICTLALKDAGVLGVGQTALAEDMNDAFTTLQQMLAQWRIKRWLVYCLTEYVKLSTGAPSYTVGPGADFDVSIIPDKIEDAFFRQVVPSQPNQIDYKLRVIQTREQYNLIQLKGLVSFADYVFYEPTRPLAHVYTYPVLNANLYELHLFFKVILQQLTTLDTVLTLPDEYEAALRYNLGVRLIPQYQQPNNDNLRALARDALNVIRQANVQVSTLEIPAELTRPGLYNVYSDRSY